MTLTQYDPEQLMWMSNKPNNFKFENFFMWILDVPTVTVNQGEEETAMETSMEKEEAQPSSNGPTEQGNYNHCNGIW